MRVSQFFLVTSKETPTDAETISHQLMLRAGMIRKLASGLYTWLPLGMRVLHKVKRIIREEMNQIQGQEILMSSVQPASLWQESARWDMYGKELLKFQDRHEREFCYGPTHEEVVSDLIRQEVRSYKQLPLTVYQIQTKFRDEIRPRFGVMRAREFIMKDAYSFHLDKASLELTYQNMYRAYSNIFKRIGVEFRAVLADTGSIGGSASHEFQVLAKSGEDIIAYSDSSDYAANIELATTLYPIRKPLTPSQTMQHVDTPTQRTILELSQFLKVPTNTILKSILVKGTHSPLVMLLLRGDHELNTCKAEKLPEVAAPLTFANDEEIQNVLETPSGFIGPVGVREIPIIADHAVLHMNDFICGANQNGQHLMHVNFDRDLVLPNSADIRNVCEGDASPDGKGFLKLTRGIEVGHIFQLGKKYSEPMDVSVTTEDGQKVILEMGCYGIGITRVVAAVIEQHADDAGIIWPDTIAPFHIALVALQSQQSQRVQAAADALYQKLITAGYEVLYDDRNVRAGVVFADMDLIGIPHRIVISERCLDQAILEYKARKSKELIQVPVDELMSFLSQRLQM